jgi:hypothetical protein
VFDVASVSSGYEIKDTGAFATRLIALMSEVNPNPNPNPNPIPNPNPNPNPALVSEVSLA